MFKSIARFFAIHQYLFALVFFASAIIFPFVFSSRYYLRMATLSLMYIMLTLGLNLVSGYMGQVSFGQAAFWGIGSYTAALLIMKLGFSTIPAMFFSMVISGIFGYLVALPSLKLKGYYLTIVTMGFCEIVRLIELNWVELTNGSLGIMNIPAFSFFKYNFKSPKSMYWIALILVIIITFVVRNLVNSSFGLSIKSIRDDDSVAETMGVNIVKVKRLTFVISSMIAGLSGAFFAQYVTYIHPSIFSSAASLEFLIIIIFGGLGSIPGTYLGAIVLTLLPELMRDLMEYRNLIYGALLVVMMIVKPDGLLGNIDFSRIRAKEYERRSKQKLVNSNIADKLK